MSYFVDLFTNGLLLCAFFAWFIAQIFKIIINLIVERRLIIERLWGDGGMPSGHSATVGALASMCGWLYGFGSVEFAISAVLAAVVMHDATGVRRETGKQAVTIKQMAEILNDLVMGKDEKIRIERLKELVGHTPLQVFFGFCLGVIVAVVYCVIIKAPYMTAGI